MFNPLIDELRDSLEFYNSEDAVEMEGLLKANLHADEIRDEIEALFAAGYYGSAEKAFIENA